MLFPPLAAQMHDVGFRYITNVLREPVCCMEGCVADSGIGKGFLDSMIEEIIRPLREHVRNIFAPSALSASPSGTSDTLPEPSETIKNDCDMLSEYLSST